MCTCECVCLQTCRFSLRLPEKNASFTGHSCRNISLRSKNFPIFSVPANWWKYPHSLPPLLWALQFNYALPSSLSLSDPVHCFVISQLGVFRARKAWTDNCLRFVELVWLGSEANGENGKLHKVVGRLFCGHGSSKHIWRIHKTCKFIEWEENWNWNLLVYLKSWRSLSLDSPFDVYFESVVELFVRWVCEGGEGLLLIVAGNGDG